MPPLGMREFKDSLLGLGLQRQDWYILAAGLLLLFCVSLYQERSGRLVRETLDKQCIWFQWIVMLGAMIAIYLFGMYGPGVSAGEFVYMQFNFRCYDSQSCCVPKSRRVMLACSECFWGHSRLETVTPPA